MKYLSRQEDRYSTKLGEYIIGNSNELLKGDSLQRYKGKVQLILTSPPYILNLKKTYGNLTGSDYREWFINLKNVWYDYLTEDGSIVIELGNAWDPGGPVQSTIPLESLLGFLKEPSKPLYLCQQFINYNPARLPSPAQWVTRQKIRVTDSYTHLWWMSKIQNPKANNQNVLRPYSKSMKNLLKSKKYNGGIRPSGHKIGEKSFLADKGGSISHNLFEVEPLEDKREVRLPNVFSHSNTASADKYSKLVREKGLTTHPAMMPIGLANYFIQFLTDENDIVLDPFAGSNTTGYSAETLGRKWLCIEKDMKNLILSELRFKI